MRVCLKLVYVIVFSIFLGNKGHCNSKDFTQNKSESVLSSPQTITYATHVLAKEFKQEMLTRGISEYLIDSVLGQASRQDKILQAISRPAEKTKKWYEYRQIFLDEKRIRNGVSFVQKHSAIFDVVETKYGVPREIIAAIIGVETRYGKVIGSYKVIDALATLAFDYPKRAPFFRSELGHLLHIAQDQRIDPSVLVGSYAGAMGYGQFMPSSYRAYAVDFTNDNKVDIWNNVGDAIASVANYLAEHGWQKNEPVATPVKWKDMDLVPKVIKDSRFNQLKKPSMKYSELTSLNLNYDEINHKLLNKNLVIQPYYLYQLLEIPISQKTEKQQKKEIIEAWLTYTNFYVITRYNHSHLYAMAVYQLSQQILSGLKLYETDQ